MTSIERVLTTLGHREPDRVPLFLLVTLLGARDLDLSIEEYFARAENVVEGEYRLWSRYGHDCVSSFFYAGAEAEAWGGETYFREDGPPTTSVTPVKDREEIAGLEPPRVEDSARLREVLKATQMLSERMAGKVPLIGIAVAPFSLPVLQMGFEAYIEVMYERPDLFDRLMAINEEFCVAWSNAQLKAGATAIAFLDPVASTTITPRDMYLKTGFEVARRTIARINGPTATHMASGHCLPIVDDIAKTGTLIVGTSFDEDLTEMKQACRDKLTVLGNLNGIEMRTWNAAQAEAAVKEAIAKAGPGGGFILSDNHGEIPWQVPDEVLMAISEAVRKWGNYPLSWV